MKSLNMNINMNKISGPFIAVLIAVTTVTLNLFPGLHTPSWAQSEQASSMDCENERNGESLPLTINVPIPIREILRQGKALDKNFFATLIKKHDLTIVPSHFKWEEGEINKILEKGQKATLNLAKSIPPTPQDVLAPKEARKSRYVFPLKHESVSCLRKVIKEMDAKIRPGSTVLFLGRSPSVMGAIYEKLAKKNAGKVIFLGYSGAPDIINSKRVRDSNYQDSRNLVTALGMERFFEYLDAKGFSEIEDLTIVDGIGSGAGLNGMIRMLNLYYSEYQQKDKIPLQSYLSLNPLDDISFKNMGIWEYDGKNEIIKFDPKKDFLSGGFKKMEIPAQFLENPCLLSLLDYFDKDSFQSQYGKVSESFSPYQWESIPLLAKNRKGAIERPGKYFHSVTEWFIERLLDPENYDEHFNTALHQAVLQKNEKLAFKALKDLKNLKGLRRPKGDQDLLKYLNTQNIEGDTPLHLAVKAKRPLLVRQLLAIGADSGIKNWSGRTPLHLSLEMSGEKGENQEMAKALLEFKADDDLPTDYGDHPLILAIGRKGFSPSFWRKMMKNKSWTTISSENKHWNLLHYAVFRESPEAVQTLLESLNTREERVQYLNKAEDDGDTPLHFALMNKALSPSMMKIIKLLVKNGADPHIKNKNGITPFEMAKKIKNVRQEKLF